MIRLPPGSSLLSPGASSLAETMENNFSSQGVLFAGWVPGVRWYHEEPDCLRYGTGLEDPWLNQVMWSNFAAPDVDRRVKQITEEYLSLQAPAMWTLRGRQPDFVRTSEALGANGWRFEGSFHGMTADLKTLPAGDTSRFTIRRVDRSALLRDWLVPFSEGFTVSESSVPFLEGMYGRILTADEHWCEFYVLYRDGEPITCGTIQTCFGLSVIYNVATIGSARGQGAATALVVELMRLLKERGCAKVALFAEKSIQPLYSRLGFVANESSISIFGIWNAPASW